MVSDTENKILQAAEEEFLNKGFVGARTIAIAEKAGVTHAMLHYYFRTKEKLFDRIITEKLDLISEILFHSKVSGEVATLEEIIEDLIERHLDFLSHNPNLPRFIIGEFYGEGERSEMLKAKIRRIAPDVFRKMQNIIDRGAATGKYRRVSARTLLTDIISLNVFPFLATPLVDTLLGESTVASEQFLRKRKHENFETIMRKLRP